MRVREVDAIAAALGGDVTAARRLAGGFSHEMLLLTLVGWHAVARLGGQDPAAEAAVMDAAGRRVPVPRVLAVLPSSATGTRPAMVIEHVPGTPLSHVLAAARPAGADWEELGAEVGRVVAGIGAVEFGRPGFFTGRHLAVRGERPWSRQLPDVAAQCMAAVPGGRLDAAVRRAWVEMCTAHAPALARIDDHARLVHADVNPKNILVTRTAGGWRVDALLDWEFAYSGCPYADAANMTRFAADYPAGFLDGFRAAFARHQPAGLPLASNWEYLGRVLDMFALSDLATRPPAHPIAGQAADEIRRWVTHGMPETPGHPH